MHQTEASSAESTSSLEAPTTDSADPSVDAAGCTKVFIVDDHPAMREVLTDTVAGQDGMQVVGGCARAKRALAQIQRRPPDVAVVDILLEDTNGLALTRCIRAQVPEARTLIFSSRDEHDYAERAVRAGASGYLMKTAPADRVAQAIERVAAGQICLSQSVQSEILSKVLQSDRYTAAPRLEALTDRERTVFQLIGRKQEVDQIAERLGLSRRTVETYRQRARKKLGCETMDALRRFARLWTRGQDADAQHDDA